MKLYDYEKYWTKAGKKYFKKFKHTDSFITQEQQFLEALKKLEFSSVFELGCGFGRITKLVKDNFDVNLYDAIDISKHQIKTAKKIEGVNFEVADFMNYQSKQKYDLVIASEVLMHIPPNLIDDTVKKLLDMSIKYAVSIDAYGKYDVLADHNFVHPYMKLYGKHEVDAVDLKNGQFMFVVRK